MKLLLKPLAICVPRTPHGEVISPLLWNIAMNKLFILLEKVGVKVNAYVDDVEIPMNYLILIVGGGWSESYDVQIATMGKFSSILSDLLQRVLNITAKYI